MNPKYFRFPLFSKDPAAGGSPNTPATPATPVANTDPEPKGTATPDPVEPSTLQKVKALGKNKGALLAERDAAAARAEAAENELATLKTSVETLMAENADLKKEKAEIDDALKASESQNATVSQAAQEKIVELGVAPADLPAAQGGAVDFKARYSEARVNGTLQTFLKENAAEVKQQLAAGA